MENTEYSNIQIRARINTFLDYDLVITYERSKSAIETGRISGHLFEAFDYWLHLTTYTGKKICIVIPDNIPHHKIKEAYEDKYVIPDRDGVGYDFSNIDIVVDNMYSNLACKNILHCSGWSTNDRVNYFGNVTSFRCGLEPREGEYTLLQDTRVYSDVPNKPLVIHYPKKIPFEFYRRYDESQVQDKILVYDNTAMRTLSEEDRKRYSNDKFMIVGSDIKLPVKDFMLKFNSYWYTPTTKTFDCSPRLITECAFFGKPVKYKVPDGYMDLDTGLFWRRHDIETNFLNVILREGDLISKVVFGDLKEKTEDKTNGSKN